MTGTRIVESADISRTNAKQRNPEDQHVAEEVQADCQPALQGKPEVICLVLLEIE